MTILDAGEREYHPSHAERRSGRVKQAFDLSGIGWSLLVGIATAAAGYGVLQARVDATEKEVERLRVRDDKQAETLATQTSVDRLADKLDALATEMRAAIAATRDKTTTNPR